MNEFNCSGHEGVCPFCKNKGGAPRSVAGMPEIDRLTGERRVDPCCKSCANNRRREKKFYERTSIS